MLNGYSDGNAICGLGVVIMGRVKVRLRVSGCGWAIAVGMYSCWDKIHHLLQQDRVLVNNKPGLE